MTETPVTASPLSRACGIGAAPRYLGSRLGCIFIAPPSSVLRMFTGSLKPKLVTTPTSQDSRGLSGAQCAKDLSPEGINHVGRASFSATWATGVVQWCLLWAKGRRSRVTTPRRDTSPACGPVPLTDSTSAAKQGTETASVPKKHTRRGRGADVENRRQAFCKRIEGNETVQENNNNNNNNNKRSTQGRTLHSLTKPNISVQKYYASGKKRRAPESSCVLWL